MRKTLLVAGLGAGLLASGVQARDGVNAAIIGGAAAGVLGGVAAGAILNAQPAPPPPAYGPPRPVYVEPREVEYVRPRRGAPICHYERRKVWLDDYDFTYRRVEVCE